MKVNLLLLLALLLLPGCEQFPKDPERTLEKVTNGKLKVGYTANPPWVVKTAGEPTGIEPELLKAFAKTLPTQISWINDSEQNLFEQLEKKKLHLVIGGITDDSPWKKRIAFTRKYVKKDNKKHVMGVIKGENAFAVRLEEFLFDHESQIREHVKETKKP